MQELLRTYNNLKMGRGHSFMEEDDFELIIDYFDEKDDVQAALEAAENGIQQFPYSSMLLLKKADLQIVAKLYGESLETLDKASVFDTTDINLYILKTDALLALDRQAEAVEVLETALDLFEGDERIELLFELADVMTIMRNLKKCSIA